MGKGKISLGRFKWGLIAMQVGGGMWRGVWGYGRVNREHGYGVGMCGCCGQEDEGRVGYGRRLIGRWEVGGML